MTLSHDVTGSGPALLLLHAAVCDRRMWEPQWRALARAGFRVVRPDFRGYGRTPAATGPYGDAEDVVELLDALGVARAAVVGSSYGGQVALELAARWPERVESLALLCSGAQGRDAGADAVAWLGPEASEVVRALVREMQLAATGGGRPTGSGADPAGVAARTLIVSGAHDLGHFRSVAAMLAGRIAGARHVELPWAGHLPNLERPAEVTELLLDFLRVPAACG
ncbi:alpha/beta fold hydrolase [Streptomyces antimicrobicus]|uniref:Alpha/beta fold hydrolase n=1 Tax=Streptomyces antimicrobicus TaxID=2883108 RepID=A0ABS8B2U4_9ACTN|nr:alpha/beta fold hydrolase [Streptomyces antimicrobicus]MCB5178925.1 alpha/beta fold hydrolase [Streptomyces antimicrobicus]